MSRTKKAVIIILATLGLAAAGGGAMTASHGIEGMPASASAPMTHFWG